jgi:hypothetical protein
MLTLLKRKAKRSRNLIARSVLTWVVVLAFVSRVYAQEGSLNIHAIDGRTGKPIKNEHLVVSIGAICQQRKTQSCWSSANERLASCNASGGAVGFPPLRR